MKISFMSAFVKKRKEKREVHRATWIGKLLPKYNNSGIG